MTTVSPDCSPQAELRRPSLPRPVLLAAALPGLRALPLARETLMPVAALPFDADRSILSAWMSVLDRGSRMARPVVVHHDRSDRALLEATLSGMDAEFWSGGDEAVHRGSSGVVRDALADCGDSTVGVEESVIIIECSTIPPPSLELQGIFQKMQSGHSWVAIDRGGSPIGLYMLSRRTLELVPPIGYFDLKEQLLPAVAAAGLSVSVERIECDRGWAGTREGYLSAVTRRGTGMGSVAGGAVVAPNARIEGGAIVCAGARVDSGALVVSSVVLPGAAIGQNAVVARSVVVPGATVAPGVLIVDSVHAAFAEPSRRFV